MNYKIDIPKVVFDPETVLEDALNFTPWTGEGDGRLPQRGDWSTFRYAAKDIVFGTATFQFDIASRRILVRSYFTGEHPVYEELEPTRAIIVIFLCQGWQAGKSLEICFEGGIPFDVRCLIERHCGGQMNGLDDSIPHELGERLFALLSGFSAEELKQIKENNVPVADVCFSAYRGVWSCEHIKAMLRCKVPLGQIFRTTPGAVTSPSAYWALHQTLRAILIEDYMLRRLEQRPMGESQGVNIFEVSSGKWRVDLPLVIDQDDAWIDLPRGQEFRLCPLVFMGGGKELLKGLAKLPQAQTNIILGIPMDVVFDEPENWGQCKQWLNEHLVGWIAVGLSRAHLTSEILQKLAQSQTREEIDYHDSQYADRHTD